MFLSKHHVFDDEFLQIEGIHKANISMERNKAEKKDCYETIKKKGSSSFINARSELLSNNIKQRLKNHTYTRLDNLLPETYVRQVFNITKQDIQLGINNPRNPMLRIVEIAGTEFVEFKKKFVDSTRKFTCSVLTEKDLYSCIEGNYIEDYERIGANSYLGWY